MEEAREKSESSDKELEAIRACQSGDLEHFGALYELYYDKIYRYVGYRVRHKESAEDVVGAVFLKAMDNIGSYNVDRGSFNSWIYRIAHNATVDHFRKQKPTEDIDSHPHIAGSTDISAEAALKEDKNKLNRVLGEMPEELQELVRLRMWDELPFAEIGVIIGRSEAACKMSFYRGLKTLRSKLEERT